MTTERPRAQTGASHPLVDHIFAVGWLWIALWIGVITVLNFADAPDWVWIVAILACVAPTFIASCVVLKNTPRTHLDSHDSVLSHFLARFTTLILAFVAWTISIVIGASISSSIQLMTDNDEREALATGFALAFESIPVVITFLWAAMIVRCTWFLARLRGWRAYPQVSRVPDSLLAGHPLWHRAVVALAHPGLLLVGGLMSAFVALLFAISDGVTLIFD